MDTIALPVTRSSDIAFESLQFNEEIERLISPQPPENETSFTALLELLPTQAVELLHLPDPSGCQSTLSLSSRNPYLHSTADDGPPTPPNSSLSSKVPALSAKKVKDEAVVTESVTKSCSTLQPAVYDMEMENKGRRTVKRKEREQQKGKGSVKKIKSESSQEAQILPYVHVRARRGQATDSHSLAERARREKINARMKLLQELVPGCSKISGTALVLDEIINHVQSLQRQVELLSMKLAAVNPRMDFRIDNTFDPEMGSVLDNSFPCLITPPIWPEDQVLTVNEEQFNQQSPFNTLYQTMWGKEFEAQNLMNSDVSILSSGTSANAMILHTDLMKMEL